MADDSMEAGYLIWRRYAEVSGDRAMVARMHMINQVQEKGLKLTVALSDGREMRIPEIVAAEAAVGALDVKSEAEWRQQWTRRLVNVAAKYQDDATTDGVVAVLNNTDAVISDMKAADIWPWAAASEMGRR